MVHFVNITETDFLRKRLLYKHLSLENALSMLNSKSIWFSNPAKWNDPFERRFLDARYMHLGVETPFSWVGKIFCTCFTQTVASEAYWKSYTANTICVELRIDRLCLLNVLNAITGYDVYIGRAEYMLTSDITKEKVSEIPFNPPIDKTTSSLTAARLFMLKRIAFKYEDEIRVLLVDKNKSSKDGVLIPYKVDNTDLIKTIVLDPSIGDNTEALLKRVFEKDYGFSPTGRGSKRVVKSSLYSKQNQAIVNLD